MIAADGKWEPCGTAASHLALQDLEHLLSALPRAPRDAGRVALLVRRNADHVRVTPERVALRPATGMPGDSWGRQPHRDPEAEITVMQVDVATMVANGQPLTLFGDNVFLELDLSVDNLPTGSRVRMGGSTLEVTAKPHNGCRKFAARFGQDALRLVSHPERRHLNLRGIHMRVVEAGELGLGDRVEVLSRGVAPR